MASGDYADIEYLKGKLHIDDTDEDQDLIDAIEDANRFVDDLLYPHASTLPLTGDQLTSAKGVANADAIRSYKLVKRDIDVSKEWKNIRDERSEALIDKLKAQPDTNTQFAAVAVASSYRSEPLASRET